MNSFVSKEKIEELCKLPCFCFETIDSTNTEAKRLITERGLKVGAVVASSQTNGRGRAGHSFYSPMGSGIYFSFFFTPLEGINASVNITTKAVTAVCDILSKEYNIECDIKWVNDIYLNGRKVCGILTEAVTDGPNHGSVIVGIGLNICTSDFPDDIKESAGSLFEEPKDSDFRSILVGKIIKELVNITNNLADNSYIKNYRQRSMLTGNRISYYENNEMKYANVIGISDDAGLVVIDDNGNELTLRNGEVSIIRRID